MNVSGAASPRRRAAELLRLVRYGLVGVVNTTVTFVLFVVLVEVGVPYALAVVPAYGAGIATSYVLNRRWTFRVAADRPSALGRFVAVQLTGMAANIGVLALLVELGGVDEVVGQAIALVVVLAGTYLTHSRWTFRS